jgi:hypothetical protein
MDHDCRQETCPFHAEHKAAIGVVKVPDLAQALNAADPFQREGTGMPYNPGIVFYPRLTWLP